MSSKDILLVTLNSTYQHAAFGLRYLYANLQDLQSRAEILEFTINQDTRLIAENILKYQPRILGLGIYIWNARPSLDLVRIIKKLSPQTVVVLGGPEVSHESESQEIVKWADYTIQGEADLFFHDFCQKILAGTPPQQKILKAPLPEISTILSPYSYYNDNDIKNRVIYVEASRGCPYKCEYCLSSLDLKVRNFPLPAFLADLDHLIQRGARQFKFVDRTFNLSPTTSTSILKFFLERIDQGLFLHFEMVPDRLPDELKDLISQFPEGSLQFEVGVQTWNPQVARNVSRRQDYEKIRQNFSFLRGKTKVHTHADLIVGLPGESLESFADGFDQLLDCGPDEIQVGILKRLKGTPIARHDIPFQMIYQEHPPYQILSNKDMSYSEIQFMVRFSKFWDLLANSGQFPNTVKFLRSEAVNRQISFFKFFTELVDFLSQRHPEGHGIALLKLVESVWIYLIENLKIDADVAREILLSDYSGKVKRDIPRFLRTDETRENKREAVKTSHEFIPKRQLRHLPAKAPEPT